MSKYAVIAVIVIFAIGCAGVHDHVSPGQIKKQMAPGQMKKH